MSKRAGFLTSVLAMALTAILGIGLPASACHGVPFKGQAAVQITAAEPGPDGLHLTVVGQGEASHIGKFTREEHVVLHSDGTLEGTLVITTAKGDRLFAEVEGEFVSPTVAIGTSMFTGGTGRFRHASGVYAWAGATDDGAHFLIRFKGILGH